jgi:hypothetical protein
MSRKEGEGVGGEEYWSNVVLVSYAKEKTIIAPISDRCCVP